MSELDALRTLLDAGPLNDALRAFKRAKIRHALERNQWHLSRTALELGVHRNTLARDLHDLGMNKIEPSWARKRVARSQRPEERAYAESSEAKLA